jgi:hypothetical protein
MGMSECVVLLWVEVGAEVVSPSFLKAKASNKKAEKRVNITYIT